MRRTILSILFVSMLGAPALADGPPALTGHDARLVIPVCVYGELLRWQPEQGGWRCDGSELTRIRQHYTAEIAALTNAVAAMPIPPLPPCDGTSTPDVCTPPPITPHCSAHPDDPACGPVAPVVDPTFCAMHPTDPACTTTPPSCSYKPRDQVVYAVCSPLWPSPLIGTPIFDPSVPVDSWDRFSTPITTVPDDDTTNYLCRNSIWVVGSDGASLVGEVVSVVKTITLASAGTYTVSFSGDNRMSAYIDGHPLGTNSCAPCTSGSARPTIVTVPLAAGPHVITATAYNEDNGQGDTWQANPAGMGFLLYSPAGALVYSFRDGVDKFAACGAGYHFDGVSLCVPDVLGACPPHP